MRGTIFIHMKLKMSWRRCRECARAAWWPMGAADPAAGTERLVIVAESRESNRAARERLAQAITAHVTETLGQPPDRVEIVPPNAIPKTSSGKLRRDETKQRFLSGELISGAPPVWLQIARLAAASSAGRICAAR